MARRVTVGSLYNLGRDATAGHRVELTDFAHAEGMEPGVGSTSLKSLIIEGNEMTYANHPFARKVVLGLSILRTPDVQLKGYQGQNQLCPVELSKGSLKRMMGNHKTSTALKFGRASLTEGTLANIKTLTWYSKHVVMQAAVHSKTAARNGFKWYINFDPRALIVDPYSGAESKETYFPPSLDLWTSERQAVLNFKAGFRTGFEFNMTSANSVAVAISDRNREIVVKGLQAELYALVRNAPTHHVKTF
eukprot:3035073-Amphidinium_carterae.2